MDVAREVAARAEAYLARAAAAGPCDGAEAAAGLLALLRGLGGHKFMVCAAAFDRGTACRRAVSRYAARAGDGAATFSREAPWGVLAVTVCWCADQLGG